MDIKQIHEQAFKLAQEATEKYINEHGDKFPCGFAWAEVNNIRTNSTLGKALQSVDFTKSYVNKRLILWNPSRLGFQDMNALAAGAEAYCEEFRKNGVEMYAMTRVD